MSIPTVGGAPAMHVHVRAAGATAVCTFVLSVLALADTSHAAVLDAGRSAYASSSALVAEATSAATVVSSRRACAAGKRTGACRASKSPRRKDKITRPKRLSKAVKKKRTISGTGPGTIGSSGAGNAHGSEVGSGVPAPTAGPPGDPPSEARPEHKTASEGTTPFRFFSSTSFWNEPLAAGAALDKESAPIVKAFDEEIATEQRLGQGPSINTVAYSVPVYTVPASQPDVRVTLTVGGGALQEAWDAVPLPSDAHPAAGSDEHLVVWQPSTDRLWEFWHLLHSGAVWTAGWGGCGEPRLD